ncbi:MAG: LCP family protein [Oscillospiraceae bacterium]|nr:LCP family protein [Oscillospiraceae bacterium]
MSVQPHNHRSERPDALTPEEKEKEYLKTLQEASDYLEKGTPLYQQEAGNKERGKGKFLKKKKPLGKRILKALAILAIVLMCMAIIATGTFLILFRVGRNKMLNYEDFSPQFPQAGESLPTAPTQSQATEVTEATEATEPTTEADRILVYDDGKTVSYKGETYVLNENITTVLLIGVDRDEVDGGEIRGEGGEADCILLMSMDTETGETKIVNISRESYAQVDFYTASEKFIETKGTQLCRSFAYGDGGVLSCENTVKSVKRLIYGMPIHSYIALDMRFIGAATDAVGGLTLTALSDVKMPDDRIVKKGTEIELWGKEAERYVRYRDKTILESNLLRMDRQKQYVELFSKKALAETKRDLTTVLELYQAMSQYMTTDLTLADVTFLLGTVLNHGATFEFSALKGRLDKLDINAIYYLDETHVYETVLDLYYTKVEP